MILLDHSIEEVSKFVVRVVGAGVDSHTGVLILDPRKNAEPEGNIHLATLVFIHFPYVVGQIPRQR